MQGLIIPSVRNKAPPAIKKKFTPRPRMPSLQELNSELQYPTVKSQTPLIFKVPIPGMIISVSLSIKCELNS